MLIKDEEGDGWKKSKAKVSLSSFLQNTLGKLNRRGEGERGEMGAAWLGTELWGEDAEFVGRTGKKQRRWVDVG